MPELSRLAEAMQDTPCAPEADLDSPPGQISDEQARKLFRDCARKLYGSDWQRETARALGRDEATLACWLIGEGVVEATPEQLLWEMLALMRQRVQDIGATADALAARVGHRQ